MVVVVVVENKVVERMKDLSFQQNKAAAELEDADIHVELERVKCAHTDVNVHANAPVDASVLLALAAQENDSVALINAVVVVEGADVRGSHSFIIGLS